MLKLNVSPLTCRFLFIENLIYYHIISVSQDNEFNDQSDCFALVISSHGEEVEEKKVHNNQDSAHVWRHCVLGSDENKVYIDDVMSYFEDKNAKGLKGKPKLFFIQVPHHSIINDVYMKENLPESLSTNINFPTLTKTGK